MISGVAEASSTVTVYSGDTALGQASADGGGAYSFTPATMLEDGTYSISATATDGAGNTGAASTALSLMVDTVVPGAPVLSVTTPTNDSTPAMGGTAEAGGIGDDLHWRHAVGSNDGDGWRGDQLCANDSDVGWQLYVDGNSDRWSWEHESCEWSGIVGGGHRVRECRRWWCITDRRQHADL